MIEHSGDMRVRGFHGPITPGGGIRRSFQSDAEAKGELDRILAAVGLNWISDRISLRASAETKNAEAGISENGQRFIFYNDGFKHCCFYFLETIFPRKVSISAYFSILF